MTIIAAAYEGPDSYAIGADTMGTVNGLRIPQMKVHRIGSRLLGATGLMADMQRALDRLNLLADADRLSTEQMLKQVWLALTTGSTEHRPVVETTFLAVGPDGVWFLETGGGTCRAPDRWAVGCGEDVGLGAMFERPGRPSEVVEVAVRAAVHLREGCNGGWTVLSTTPATKEPPR